jgi:hypothetical protein
MRFKNTSGDTWDLPTLGENGLRVGPDEEFDATGEDAKNLSANPAFERADKSKTSSEEK